MFAVRSSPLSLSLCKFLPNYYHKMDPLMAHLINVTNVIHLIVSPQSIPADNIWENLPFFKKWMNFFRFFSRKNQNSRAHGQLGTPHVLNLRRTARAHEDMPKITHKRWYKTLYQAMRITLQEMASSLLIAILLWVSGEFLIYRFFQSYASK